MSFDEEQAYPPTQQDYEDMMLLHGIWEQNPDIQTLQMKKMIFDNEVLLIARAAIAHENRKPGPLGEALNSGDGSYKP